MRILLLALCLAGCSVYAPINITLPSDGGAPADMTVGDMTTGVRCGNGNVYCQPDEVCMNGDCLPACYFEDAGCQSLTHDGQK